MIASRQNTRTELTNALRACRSAFLGIGVFSGMSNILMLTGSFFMLEIYDRVLPSRSVPTLVGLILLAFMLFIFQGAFDLIRSRLLVRIGRSLDQALGRRIYDTILQAPLRLGNRNEGLQPLRDLDSVRGFLSSLGPTALFDLPWMPLYLGICFAFHFWIGVTVLAGAAVLIALTLLTEILTRAPTLDATSSATLRLSLAETGRRNAEPLSALGMSDRIAKNWCDANERYMEIQQRLTDLTTVLGTISKVFRLILQSGVLAVGAYLVIQQEATSGVIIASSILAARTLAPVDLAIANWKSFVIARQSWTRMKTILSHNPVQKTPMSMPRPRDILQVEGAAASPPGVRKVTVSDVSFTLKRGQALGVIGSSASGKSSLARMLVGIWPPAHGKVCLDGATLDQWAPDVIGRDIGYLPQNVELISGTVAENIARFQSDANAKDIIAAANAAGVHDLIVRLPSGYETQVGEQGNALSAGQRQRVALARALYGDPFLVVLDEPNSNLDREGEAALTAAILRARMRGAVVVVIAHRSSALAGVDLLLFMNEGRPVVLGPKEKVLAKLAVRETPGQMPLKVVADNER